MGSEMCIRDSSKLPFPVYTLHCSHPWPSMELVMLLSYIGCGWRDPHTLANHLRLPTTLSPSIFLQSSPSYHVPRMPHFCGTCFCLMLCRADMSVPVLRPLCSSHVPFLFLIYPGEDHVVLSPGRYSIYAEILFNRFCSALFCILFHLHPLQGKHPQGKNSAHLSWLMLGPCTLTDL